MYMVRKCLQIFTGIQPRTPLGHWPVKLSTNTATVLHDSTSTTLKQATIESNANWSIIRHHLTVLLTNHYYGMNKWRANCIHGITSSWNSRRQLHRCSYAIHIYQIDYQTFLTQGNIYGYGLSSLTFSNIPVWRCGGLEYFTTLYADIRQRLVTIPISCLHKLRPNSLGPTHSTDIHNYGNKSVVMHSTT